jgi:hypothetical protein
MTTRPMKMRPAELVLVTRVTKFEVTGYMILSPRAVSLVVQVAVGQLSLSGMIGDQHIDQIEDVASL